MPVRCCTLTVARSWLNGWLSVEKIGAGQRLGASGLGAPGRTRTSDTRFRKPVLYPLSYGGAKPV
jgi:hypothetical protein